MIPDMTEPVKSERQLAQERKAAERDAKQRAGYEAWQAHMAAEAKPPKATDPRGDDLEAQVIRILTTLQSIRAMLIFFTVLAILGIIGGIISSVELVHAANNSGSGF